MKKEIEVKAKVEDFTHLLEELSGLGVQAKDRVLNGYDTLVWLKDNSPENSHLYN